MGTAAKPTRENRTITVDFRDDATYFHLIAAGKAFVECVLAFLVYNWLQVLRHAETPQIDQGVGHQLHAIVPRWVLETQQQPLEFVLPRKRPLDALP